MEAPDPILKRKPQVSVDAWHFSECSCTMIFRLGERWQSEPPR